MKLYEYLREIVLSDCDFKKEKMRNKAISISSDSLSDEDVPLKKLKQNGYMEDPNSYDNLCKHSLEACEFCDEISNNRYSSLIHNVRHIIIPLLNQTVFQCTTCLHSFTSEKDLRTHRVNKHLEPIVPQKSKANDLKSKRNPSQSSSHSNTKESQLPKDEPNIIYIGTENNDTKSESLKNRLVFEDDDLIVLDFTKSDQLLADLTTDCKVKLELFHTPWLNGAADKFSGKSVHYDELVKPGVYRCKKCGKGFPIRYDAIIHETSHIKFKNSQISLCVICKKYLIGGKNDLRHHYLTFHKANIENIKKTESEECISKLFEEKKTFDSKILSLCDLCFSFCKNKSHMNYECINTISKIGRRHVCDKCGQLFFEINLVRRSLQRRALYVSQPQRRRKTNEDRLKTIASRLKKMKH